MLPDLPALLRPDVHRGQGPASSALACVRAYNDWMVEEWCGDSRRPPDPAAPSSRCGTPSWRPPRSGATPRAGVRAVCFSEIPPHLGLPSIHTGDWDPFFAACAGDRHGRLHAHRLVVADAGHLAPTPRPPSRPRSRFNNAMASMTDWLFSGVLVQLPDLKLAYSEGQIGWIPYILERADDVWEEHRAWGGVQRPRPRAAVDLLLPADLRLLLPRPARPRRRSTRSASTTSPSRPTTRTPTRRGPTPRRSPTSHVAGPRRRDASTRSCAATPSACSASTSTSSRAWISRTRRKRKTSGRGCAAWLGDGAARPAREAPPRRLAGPAGVRHGWQRMLYDAGYAGLHWPRTPAGRAPPPPST